MDLIKFIIEKYTRVIFLFIFICNLQFVLSNDNAIYINSKFKKERVAPYLFVYRDSTYQLQIDDLIKKKNAFKKAGNTNFNEAFIKAQHCFKFDVENKLDKEKNLVLELAFHDINNIRFYIVSKDSIINKSIQSGDHYPFYQRSIITTNFAYSFQLPSNSIYSIYVIIDVNEEPLIAPFYLWDKETYFNKNSNFYFLYGIYYCFIIFFILLAFVIWIVYKNKLNLYYLFYLISLFLFLFSVKGFGFQYLWPSNILIQDLSDFLLIGIMCIFSLFFACEFLEFKTNSNFIFFINKLFIFITIFSVILSPFTRLLNTFWLNISQFIFLSILAFDGFWVLLASIIIYFTYKKFRYFIYLFAYSFVSSGFIIYFFTVFDIIPDGSINKNLMIYNALLEMLIFSTFLTYNVFKLMKKQSNIELELMIQKQQAAMGILYGEEKERKRLSLELHDGLGLQLSILKNRLSGFTKYSDQIENQKVMDETTVEIDKICRDIRNLSHNLSPVSLEKEGLLIAFKNTIDLLNKNSSCLYFFSSSNKEIKIEDKFKEKVIYRIFQELVNNAIKHSQATEIHISFEAEEENYILVVRDNGIGFNLNESIKKGIGFKNIKSRLELYYGTIEINSEINYGSLITVVIPI